MSIQFYFVQMVILALGIWHRQEININIDNFPNLMSMSPILELDQLDGLRHGATHRAPPNRLRGVVDLQSDTSSHGLGLQVVNRYSTF